MPERRRSGTAKINTLTSAIADVASVEKRLTPLAHPRLTCRRQSMSEAYCGGSACGAIRHESSPVHALGAAGWLSLAAAPTFAIMALLTGLGGGPPDMLCSAAHEASPLSGMLPMYLLMSAFHSTPWLKLISSRRGTTLLSRPWAKLGKNLSKTSAPSPAGRTLGEKT
jgi:hypothetical protein